MGTIPRSNTADPGKSAESHHRDRALASPIPLLVVLFLLSPTATKAFPRVPGLAQDSTPLGAEQAGSEPGELWQPHIHFFQCGPTTLSLHTTGEARVMASWEGEAHQQWVLSEGGTCMGWKTCSRLVECALGNDRSEGTGMLILKLKYQTKTLNKEEKDSQGSMAAKSRTQTAWLYFSSYYLPAIHLEQVT